MVIDCQRSKKYNQRYFVCVVQKHNHCLFEIQKEKHQVLIETGCLTSNAEYELYQI